MRWIRFEMSKGKPMSFPEEKAQKIIEDNRQLLMIFDERGKWTGKTINKAYVVSTDYDIEKELDEDRMRKMRTPKLNAAKLTPEQKKAVEKAKQKIRDKFKIKK